MEPSDFSSNDEAFSALAGMLWSMFSRLRAEGASLMEAAMITGQFGAAVVTQPQKEDTS